MSFHVEKNVMVPMRDGTKLATDVWMPDGVSSAPVLLARLPYSKDAYPAAEIDYITTPNIFVLLDAGYAIVYQDCRGTGMSEGQFVPMVNEAEDGVDTVAWIRDQSWCDGNLGSFGHSYLGITQWATASRAPEGLKAIATAVTSADSYLAPWYSPGGALSWHSLWYWTIMMVFFPTNDVRDSVIGPGEAFGRALAMIENADEAIAKLPARDQPLYLLLWSWWSDVLDHSDRDAYWQSMSALDRIKDVTAPALQIGGWFDIFVAETTRSFIHARRDSASEGSRAGQRLVIGPWDHNYMIGEYHDRQFGPMSSAYAADLTQAQLDFFERHVRGKGDAPDMAPVRIFVMGANEWRDERDWPLPDTTYVDYFLGATRDANSVHGGGTLSLTCAEPGSQKWTYDPMDPVPTAGGRVMGQAAANKVGPVDQRPVEERDDVLVFSTEPLEEAVSVIGEVSAVLHVLSDAVDTDVTVKLVDVAPDGCATYLTDGILRMRYRHSLTDPVLLTPGQMEEVTIEVGPTANVFLPGHRIRVEVASSNFPRYDRNLNTAERPATASSGVVAHNEVHHGHGHPSRIVLPVITRT